MRQQWEGEGTVVRKVDGTDALARIRELRREATPEEKLLWSRLRARRLEGYDFLCKEARLIVEVDGSQHAAAGDYDERRSRYLRARGYRVLRFWNNDVMGDLEAVLTAIRAALLEAVPSPSPTAAPRGPLPLPERERGR